MGVFYRLSNHFSWQPLLLSPQLNLTTFIFKNLLSGGAPFLVTNAINKGRLFVIHSRVRASQAGGWAKTGTAPRGSDAQAPRPAACPLEGSLWETAKSLEPGQVRGNSSDCLESPLQVQMTDKVLVKKICVSGTAFRCLQETELGSPGDLECQRCTWRFEHQKNVPVKMLVHLGSPGQQYSKYWCKTKISQTASLPLKSQVLSLPSRHNGTQDYLAQLWRIHLPMQGSQEMRVSSLGQEDPLEEEMATHSNILAWRIPWTEEPGGLQSMELQRVGHDWANKHARIVSLKFLRGLCKGVPTTAPSKAKAEAMDGEAGSWAPRACEQGCAGSQSPMVPSPWLFSPEGDLARGTHTDSLERQLSLWKCYQ